MGISLDEVILNGSTHSIAINDGTNTLVVNGDGSINSVVTATNLDIRDLAFATDKVDVSGSTVELGATSLAALESITVTATNLDIRDLTFAADKVDVSGSAVTFTPTLYTAIKNSAETVTTTAAQVLSTPLADRKEVTIQNEGSQDVYIGSSGSVTTSNGIKISKASSATYLIPASVDIFMVASSGSQSVRFLELA